MSYRKQKQFGIYYISAFRKTYFLYRFLIKLDFGM